MLIESSHGDMMIGVIMRVMRERAPTTLLHSIRVAGIATDIAGSMLGGEAAHRVFQASLLHDVGKLYIPRRILDKPQKLTREEQVAMRHHPCRGFRILNTIPPLAELSKIVLYHHERYDGSGYPEGISKETIPLESRIISVADAFDAMISKRPYRRARSIHKALSEIIGQSGKQFDPRVVLHFHHNLTNSDSISLIDPKFASYPECRENLSTNETAGFSFS